MWMSVYPQICVCVPYAPPVPAATGRRHWIFWNCSSINMGAGKMNPGPLQES